MPSCSCGCEWAGTTAPGSNSIRLIIAPVPKSGWPRTPGASSNARRSVSLTNCGSILRSSPARMSARKEYRVAGQAEPISHYTDAVRAGDLLFVSGCIADVVKVTVFLTDVDDRARINPVRQEVFGDVRPASTLVEVSRLAVPGSKIEVEAVALLP